MKGFEDVTFSWDGESYTVPANRQLMLIAKIEAALCGDTGRQAIDLLLQKSGPPHAHLAMAYEAALKYAGADVSEGEVYLAIMEDLTLGSAEALTKIQTATLALLSIIAPPIGREMRASEKPGKKPKSKG